VLHALDAIERNAMAQSQRLSDLLDVSSIRSGGLKVSLHPMLPASAVELALEEVEADASARQLTIHRALEPGAGPILGEASRIQQVAECLLRNAVRFSADGGAIFVSLARRGDSVELAVRDEGRGIPRDELPQLFDQFRRSEVSSPRLKLGLTIVSYITERHGGTVTAESAGEGLGATFRVGFPS
jgi:signal transduction histidine kinase